MPSRSPLVVSAGPEALQELRDAGLRPERVRAFVGASGGPKWLVLHGLDRMLMPWLCAAKGEQPLHTVGTSIGSWRAACLAASDPVTAIDALCEAYVEQRYAGKPSAAEVSAEGERILGAALAGTPLGRMVDHPRVRMHVVTARLKGLAAREGRAQALGLGLAIALNVLDRRALGVALQRVVFDAAGQPGPFAPWQTLPTEHVTLTADNVLAALYASAAIPLVMRGVVDPPDAPRGTYRDGGVADYHFGREIDVADGLTLYPHFFAHLVPGWFDKGFAWRRTRGLRRVVLLSPSAEFVASLPYGRIPDRKDFERMSDAQRIACWRTVLARSAELGDAFSQLVARGALLDEVQPLP